MSQRGTSAMILFFMASLVVFGDTVFNYADGRGLAWRGILGGVMLAAAGIYFRTARSDA